LTGHTHDALPKVVEVGKTLLVASGSHGKFLSRLDLEVKDGKLADYRYRLIPVFSDAIAPDPEMTALIDEVRAPFRAEIDRVLGQTDSLLYRRGNFNGTFDDLICNALLEERDAQIALSPGFRWGATLLPGQDITVDDVYTQTAITYPNAYRNEMTGEFLKTVLEDVADNLFNPDPYYQQGGDMVRIGGMDYACAPAEKVGNRISDLTLDNGRKLEAGKTYKVAGWASVNPQAGKQVWDVFANYLRGEKTAKPKKLNQVALKGVANNPGVAG
jgi:sulfur-oxidizing protein SoxB